MNMCLVKPVRQRLKEDIEDDQEIVTNFLNSIDSKENFSSIDERNIWRLFSFYKWIDINGVKLVN